MRPCIAAKSKILNDYFHFLKEQNYENIQIKKKKQRKKNIRVKIWQSILNIILFHTLHNLFTNLEIKNRKSEIKEFTCDILNVNIKTIEDNERQLKKALSNKFDFPSYIDKGIGYLRKFNLVKSQKKTTKSEISHLNNSLDEVRNTFLEDIKKIILNDNEEEIETIFRNNQKLVFFQKLIESSFARFEACPKRMITLKCIEKKLQINFESNEFVEMEKFLILNEHLRKKKDSHSRNDLLFASS